MIRQIIDAVIGNHVENRVFPSQELTNIVQLFLRIIYLLAVAGALLKPKRLRADLLPVFMYIAQGWALVIMLTEEQSRYRYPAMPAFFMLAAVGLAGCWKIAKAARGKN